MIVVQSNKKLLKQSVFKIKELEETLEESEERVEKKVDGLWRFVNMRHTFALVWFQAEKE